MTQQELEQIRAIVQAAVAPLQAAQTATDAKIDRLEAKMVERLDRLDDGQVRIENRLHGLERRAEA